MQQSEIVAIAKAAGLSDQNAILASAVAMGESGGNPRAHTVDNDDDSYGLWQINMKGSMGPVRRKLYGLASNDDLYDPATNAHVMSSISSQGRNWSAWGAYTNGSYKAFMPSTSGGAKKLLGGILTGANDLVGGVRDAAGSVVDVATSASQAVDALQRGATWISAPKNWVRVVYVVGGGVLVVAALVGVISSTRPGQAAISTGKKLALKKFKAGQAASKAGPEFAVRARKAAEEAARESQRTARAAARETARKAAAAASKAAKEK